MLLKNMQVLEIMKTHVVVVTVEATLAQAADLLDLYQTTGLPVVDSVGVLQGMLTEYDIERAVTALAAPAANQSVRDWMSVPVVSIDENADLSVAVRHMRDRRLKRLPVTSEAGKLVGVLNRIDILQAVFEGTLDDVSTDRS